MDSAARSQDFQKGGYMDVESVCNAYIAATKQARTVMFNGSKDVVPWPGEMVCWPGDMMSS